jgi:uncharacterized membrane protein YqgA involved in biofilm formation
LIGSALGLLVGNRLSARIQDSVNTGLGLTTLFVGFSNAGETGNVIIPLLSLVIGAIIGELLRLDAARSARTTAPTSRRRHARSSGRSCPP